MKLTVLCLMLLAATSVVLAACEKKPTERAPKQEMSPEDINQVIGKASSPIIRQTPVVPYASATEVRVYAAESGTTDTLPTSAKYVTLTAAQRGTLDSAFSYIERAHPENAVHFGPQRTEPRYLFRYVDASGATVGELHVSFCGEALKAQPEIFAAPPAVGAQPFVNYVTLKSLIAGLKVKDVTACS